MSIATTVDANDNSKLTLVASVVKAHHLPQRQWQQMYERDGTTDGNVSSGSDFALLLIPSFVNGRAGAVAASRDGQSITGASAGLQKTTVHTIQGKTFRLPATPVNRSVELPSVYMGVELQPSTPAVVSTDADDTPTAVISKTETYRAKEAAALHAVYGPEWSDVKVR